MKLKELKDKGITFTLATGRAYFGLTKQIVKGLNLTFPQIVCGGSMIIDPQTNELLWHKPISAESTRKIINYLSWLNEKINAPVSVSILSSDYYNITPPDLCTNKMRCKNPSLMCKLSNKVSRGKCVPKKYLQIFLSSLVSRGNLGGLSGADNKCKQMAKNANLKGVFKAFLSNSKENVALRIKIKNLPYLTVDGYIIANNFSDLSQNKLNYPLVVNEKGQHEILDDEPFTAINVFTGTNQDLSTGSHCGDWKKDNQTIYGTYGITGFNKQKSSSWLYHTIGSCYDPYRIYCIEDEK